MRTSLNHSLDLKDVRHFIVTLCLSGLVATTGFVGSAEARQSLPDSTFVQFIFTSDAHYGESRKSFRGKRNVDGRDVNVAMIKGMNAVSACTFPERGGVKAGALVGPIDYIIQTGDVANRQESGRQNASISWRQFLADYDSGVTLRNRQNKKTELLVVPGNHDVSNAIGFYRTLQPRKDPSSVVGMYNLMLKPSEPLTNSSFSYQKHKVHYSRDIGEVHFVFVHVWPDVAERIWMTKDLSTVPPGTPVLLFAHDPPSAPSKHFINPNAGHAIDSLSRFENILAEPLKDGLAISAPSLIEQRGLADFLKSNPNIKAYFHGHDHDNKFYTWNGPDSSLALSVFQVDAPMWESEPAAPETTLSFQVISINLSTRQMTVRECLWNNPPSDPAPTLAWGRDTTVTLR